MLTFLCFYISSNCTLLSWVFDLTRISIMLRLVSNMLVISLKRRPAIHCLEAFFLPREMSCLESIFCGNHPLSVVNWTRGGPLASVDALLVSWVPRLGGEGLCFEMNNLKITSAEITSLLITCRILGLPPTPWRERSLGTGQRHKMQKVFTHIHVWKHPVGRKWEGVFWSS